MGSYKGSFKGIYRGSIKVQGLGFMGSYKWGYKLGNCNCNPYSGTSNPTYNYP